MADWVRAAFVFAKEDVLDSWYEFAGFVVDFVFDDGNAAADGSDDSFGNLLELRRIGRQFGLSAFEV